MLRSLFCFLASGTLFGCTTVGPNFEAPGPPQTAKYAMAGDVSPDLRLDPDAVPARWWTRFGSAQIDALVDAALSQNQTLAAADASLARARANARAVRGAAGVQVDGHTRVERERVNTASFGIEGFPSPTISLYSIGASASFDFDLFGGGRRRIESAEAQAAALAARGEAAYLTLSGEVVLRAIETAALREQISASEQMIAESRRNVEMTRRAVDAGGAPRGAVVTAQAQLAEDKARLPPLQSKLAVSRHALALLAGRGPGDWNVPDIDLASIGVPAAVPLSVPSELVRRRPDILAAEARLHAATADIGVATAALYPQLRLTPDFTLSALKPGDVFNFESGGWVIGPALSLPIFHSGQLQAERKAAVAARNEALAEYRQTVLVAFVQIADLLHAAAQDQALAEAQAEASEAADENARLANLAYQNGAGSLLSVLDAQRQSHRAKLAFIDAQASLRRDLAALFVASAADWRPPA